MAVPKKKVLKIKKSKNATKQVRGLHLRKNCFFCTVCGRYLAGAAVCVFCLRHKKS